MTRDTGGFFATRLTLALLALLLTCDGLADGGPGVGLRYGMGASGTTASFRQIEVVARTPLGFRREVGSDWTLTGRMEYSLGRLGLHRQDTVTGSVGPVFVLSRRPALAIEAGFSPTLIGRHAFRGRDLGCELQFTSHLGVSVAVNDRLRIGYRFQHMSNADIVKPNPGLNMHMFTVAASF